MRMKSNILFLSYLIYQLWFCLASFTTSGQDQEDLTNKFDYLFESDTEGYKCFRIPAMVLTTKGTILAFAEGRKRGCSDTGNIDLVMKRSEDGGKTWGNLMVVWNDADNTCGNPAPVVDEETGDIFLLSTWNLGSDHEREIISGDSKDTRRVFVLSSSDDGKTWSGARDITAAVKRPDWTWYATGPGAGIQLKKGKYKGRLVIPCDHIESDTKKYYSHAIYSDDHGKSWELGGVTPQDQVNECKVVELRNGDLMLNMRNYDRNKKTRQVSISKDGGASWSDLSHDDALIEPICQASLIQHKFPGERRSCLVFSNPASEGSRTNMTVRLSYDDGKTWPYQKVVHAGPSAYSDLLSLPDGNFACFYEGGVKSPYEGIAFEVFSRKVIGK